MAVNDRKFMASFYFISHLFLLHGLFLWSAMRDYGWMYFAKLENIGFILLLSTTIQLAQQSFKSVEMMLKILKQNYFSSKL